MKTKIITLLLVLLIAMYTVPTGALGASLQLGSTSFDKETATLTFSGTVSGCREEYVHILITSVSISDLNITDLNASKQVFTSVKTNSDGSFSGVITLPDAFPGGKLTLVASCDGVSDTYYFSYISMGTLNLIASRLTSGITSSGVEGVLNEYLNELLIETDYFNSIKSTICPILTSLTGTGYTGERFYNTLNHSIAVYELKNGTGIQTVFERYLTDILDYNADFDVLDQNVKDGVKSSLLIADFTRADFLTIYSNIVDVETIKNAQDYTALKSYILNNNIRLGIDLTSYNLKTDYAKDIIMKTMYMNLANVINFSDIKTVFDSACNSVSSNSGSNKTPPGNAGGQSSSRPSGQVSFSPSAPSIPSADPVVPSGSALNDIKGHWAENAINTLVSENVITGYTDGSFKPENNVTRAEFTKMVSVLLKGDFDSSVQFSDVNSGDWYCDSVIRLASAGIINGYNGSFYPEGKITREDAAVIIERLLAVYGTSATGNSKFTDDSQIADYAKNSVAYLADIGVIKGYNNLFNPKNNLTRAEAATILCNILDKIN